MCAIEPTGPEKPAGVVVVDRVVYEVDVRRLAVKPGERVRHRGVHPLHKVEGTLQVGVEFDLESVVNGTAHGFQELNLAEVGILARKGNLPGANRRTPSPEIAVGQTIV